MGNRKTKFFVGLFMAAGIGIALVAIIWLGMSRVFEKGKFYAVYFDETVQGLNVDSPVKYRGVAIGRVVKIAVAPDSRLIEVVLKVESAGLKPETDMFAQLKVVGITGAMFIELDRRKEGMEFVSPELKFPTAYPVVASRPSDIRELMRGIDDIVKAMNTMDLGGISQRIKSVLEHVDESVLDADIAGISQQLRSSLAQVDEFDLPGISREIKETLGGLKRDLDPDRWQKILNEVEKTIHGMQDVSDNAATLLTSAGGVLDQTGEGMTSLNRQLIAIAQEVERASTNLNRLLERVAEQPSDIIFSQPPPRRLPYEQEKMEP